MSMKKQDKLYAEDLGIEVTPDMPIKTLVRAIQQARGDTPCFLSDKRYDCAGTCEWASDCKPLVAEWLR